MTAQKNKLIFGTQMELARTVLLPLVPRIKVAINPPEVVKVDNEGFRVDMNNMRPFIPYMVQFLDSRYVIWKDGSGSLVVTEAQ